MRIKFCIFCWWNLLVCEFRSNLRFIKKKNYYNFTLHAFYLDFAAINFRGFRNFLLIHEKKFLRNLLTLKSRSNIAACNFSVVRAKCICSLRFHTVSALCPPWYCPKPLNPKKSISLPPPRPKNKVIVMRNRFLFFDFLGGGIKLCFRGASIFRVILFS